MNKQAHEKYRQAANKVSDAISKAMADGVSSAGKLSYEQQEVNRIAYSSKPMTSLASTIDRIKAGKSAREFSRMYEGEVTYDAD